VKHFLKTATIAALAVATLTAAAEPQQERYRFLGHTDQGVLLSTDATGPQNARKVRTVVATATAALPGEADNAEVGLVIDCTAKTAAINGLVTYLGDVEKVRLDDATTEPTAINPGSPNELVYGMVCSGTAVTPAVYVTGVAKARAYALAEAKK